MRIGGRRLRRATVAIAAVMLAAACSTGGDGQTPDDPTMDGSEEREQTEGPLDLRVDTSADRDAAVLEAALREGQVTWYTSLAGPVVSALSDAFEAAYPDISLTVFRSPQTDLVARTTQEHAVGRVEADVFETNQDAALLLADNGILTRFTTPHADDGDPRWLREGSDGAVTMIGSRVSYVGFAYNTDLLDAEELPRSLTDLADPVLAGQLALPTSTTGIRWVGNVMAGLGQDAGRGLLLDMGSSGVRLEAVSGAGLADMIATGEVAASPAIFRNHALALQEDGAPIDWIPLEPALGNLGVVALPANAPHPNAGLLLADLILGPEGERILAEHRYPRPDEEVGFDSWSPDDDFGSSVEQQEAFETWSQLFDEAFT